MLCLFGANSVCEFLQGHGATLLRQACGQLWPRGHMRLASKSGPNKSLKGRMTAALLAMRWFASIGIWICLPACVWHVHLFACSMLACLHTALWLVFPVCVQVKVSQPSTHSLCKTCMDASWQQMLLSGLLSVHQDLFQTSTLHGMSIQSLCHAVRI